MKLKTKQVATPFFTPSDAATIMSATLHEKNMLINISPAVLECMSSIFQRTKDDNLVMKIFRGFQQICKVCAYFKLSDIFNEVVSLLLGDGREYVLDVSILMNSDCQRDLLNINEDVPMFALDDQPLRANMKFGISSNNCKGAATHRGLLSLYFGFYLVQEHATLINDSWSIFIDCVFALREVKALPQSLVELDDFADSNGNMLPPTRFALQSRVRWEKYIRTMKLPDNYVNQTSVWESVTNVIAPPVSDETQEEEKNNRRIEQTERIRNALSYVARNCDSIIIQKRNIIYVKIFFENLLDAIDPSGQYIDSPLFEYHAVFALELAARMLLCHRKCAATELYPLIFSKLRVIIGGGHSKKIPYLVERACVTIMRSCIHLLDVIEVR